MSFALRPEIPTPTLDLAELIAPLTIEEFLSEYWGKKPLYMKAADPGRFTPLFSVDRFEEALRSSSLPVYATFNDYGNAKAKRHQINNEILLDIQQRDCVRAMADVSLTVGDLQKESPSICAMLSRFKKDLRHGGGIKCIAWISKPNAGLPTHFDESTSFMLQIAGRKRWRCSRIPAIEFPTVQGLRGEHGEAMYLNFRSKGINNKVDEWLKHAVPIAEEAFVEFTMEPGDACFIPAGVWHTTRAIPSGDAEEIDSLGLNIRMSHVSMWDLFSAALKRELTAIPAWRHLPVEGNTRHDVLTSMLEDLRHRLSELSPESLDLELNWLKAISSFNGLSTDALDVTPETRLRLSTTRPVVAHVHDPDEGPIYVLAGDGAMRFAEKRFLPFARQLLRGGEFRADSAAAWFQTPCEWKELKDILQRLNAAGIVERV